MRTARASLIAALMVAGCQTLPPHDPLSKFESRAENCQHWGGEEPYDQQRAAEIARAIRVQRCDALKSDGDRLLHLYRNDDRALGRVRTVMSELD